MDANHFFPQRLLAAILLVVDVSGDGVSRAGAGCEVGLLHSVAVIALLGVGSDPKCLA